MPRYLIESPHTDEECLPVLDWILAHGSILLSKYEFCCMEGNHTGYVIIEAPTRTDARHAVPPSIQNKARIVELQKFTPEQIRSFHTGH